MKYICAGQITAGRLEWIFWERGDNPLTMLALAQAFQRVLDGVEARPSC